MRRIACAILIALGASSCATARLHSVEEINAVGRDCGVALGELFQDESEKRLLFLMRPGASAAERACVIRWARKHHMKTVIVEAINFPEES